MALRGGVALALALLAAAAHAADVAGGGAAAAAAVAKKRHGKHHKPPTAGPGFDLFVFVRSYSPTFCRQTACSRRPITAFTIHGLWPEFATGGWPQFCEGGGDDPGGIDTQQQPQADPDGGAGDAASSSSGGGGGGGGRRALRLAGGEAAAAAVARRRAAGGATEQPLNPSEPEPEPEPEPRPPATPQQQCEWPSFAGSDAGFWDHEFTKHGTCARPVTGDRAAFFNATMRLHEALDLDVALAVAGILPSDDTAYATRALEAAVEDAFSVAPLLSCFHGQLLEVWLCVGLDLKVRTCPPGVLKEHPRTCGRTVSLPVGAPVPPECRPYFPPWQAPSGGGPNSLFVRLATGAAVAGAAAAAVLLFVRGARQASHHRTRLLQASAAGEAGYDPLGSWLQKSDAIRPPRSLQPPTSPSQPTVARAPANL